MRIVIVTSSSSRSGGTRQAIYQARGLAELGHEVSLALPENSTFWELPHDPLWRAIPNDSQGWRRGMEALLFPKKERWAPAIVHAFHNKGVKRAAWWGLFWRRRGVVCVAHRGVLYRPTNPLPYLSPAMQAFIVNSQACAGAIGLYTPTRKIHVVPNAVPDERVTPRTSPDDMRRALQLEGASGPCFVYVGNDSRIKGAEELLRAFADASLPSANLILIGTNPERWRPLCAELGIAGQVRHPGSVENVSDYLQLADAFVFPTNLDSAPNTLLEAIRMGLPIVATNVGGVPEIAVDNGILTEPGDKAALKVALRRMAESPEQRTLWAEKSRSLGERYSVTARCTALETIYRSLLKA